MFTREHIEFHAATCGEKFSIILTDDEDDNDVTMPYQQESNSIEIAKNQINVTELLKGIKHQHICNGESKYRIRRNNAFEDFAVNDQKPWISPCKLINVTFIGEPSVDIGGPRK